MDRRSEGTQTVWCNDSLKRVLIQAGYIVVSLVILVSDRLSKHIALSRWIDPVKISDILSFETILNRGFSWSMFHSDSQSVFAIVTAVVVMITALVAWHAYTQIQLGKNIWGELLIISGSISNIIDRIWFGGVVDFIAFSYQDWVFPVFNIADMAVVTGVFILLIKGL